MRAAWFVSFQSCILLSSLALPQQDPFTEPGGGRKCRDPKSRALHKYFCDHMDRIANGTVRLDRTKGAVQALYDEYHKDRGHLMDLGSFEYGKTLLRMLPVVMPPKKGLRVLEGGVGSCAVLREMVNRGYDAYGHEVSAYAVDTFCKGLNVTKGLLQGTEYSRDYFGLIYSVDVIEHIAEPDILPTFRELYRIAAPGALLLFNVAPCSKNCGGVCNSNVVHASGLCDTFPRPWWDKQLETAGFKSCDPVTWTILENLGGLRTGQATTAAVGANPIPLHRNFMKGGWPWNLKWHNWWFFHKPALSDDR